MKRKTTILEADSFLNDAYGWLTNQISHIGLGVAVVFCLCMAYFAVFAEMPHKMNVYLVVLSGYVAYELLVQKWHGWDTIEDTVFVTGYGAGGVLSAFSEVDPGSSLIAVEVVGLAPFFVAAVVHLIAGHAARRS